MALFGKSYEEISEAQNYIQNWERYFLFDLAVNMSIRNANVKKDYGENPSALRIPATFCPDNDMLHYCFEVAPLEKKRVFETLDEMILEIKKIDEKCKG